MNIELIEHIKALIAQIQFKLSDAVLLNNEDPNELYRMLAHHMESLDILLNR